MRILLISHFVPYPPHGGSRQRNYNLLREVAKEHEIHLVTFNQRKLLARDRIEEAKQELLKYCRSIRVFDVPSDFSRLRWYGMLLLNLLSSAPYSTRRFKSREFTEEIKRLLGEVSFDLVCVDTIAIANYGFLVDSIPRVLNHQNVESSLLLRRARNERNPFTRAYIYLQGKKLRNYEKKIICQYDLNLTVSPLDLEELRGYAPDTRYEVIANGTDIEYFKPSTTEVSKEIIYAGGMTWYPNRDAMSYFCREIFPVIKKQVPEVRMNIVGGTPPKDVVEAAKGDPKIILHGFVDDIRPLVNKAAVYVVPIRVGGGTRLKILDAFALGKALVSTSVGCEGIDVTPEENLLVSDDPGDFASAVVRLLNDSRLRQKLERNARKFVEEHYSWKVIGSKLNELYREIAT